MYNVNGSVQFTEVIQGYSNSWGYKDTITFNAGGSNPYLLNGTLTAQNGVTYTF
jgi:long-subunit fatty acid transport protein